MLDYQEYERLFNAGDDDGLVERFFADDIEFITASRTCAGKAQLREFLAFAHDGVLERMRPQKVLQDERHILAEIDMDFHCVRPRPDFPFGPLLPGDSLTVKFFVTYTTRAGKVTHFQSATWPPGRGVSTIPRLGSHPSQLAALRAYLAAFSRGDAERFTTFYTDEVEVVLGSVGVLRGKQTVGDFYRNQTRTVEENIEILDIEASDAAITVHTNAHFTAIAAAPDFPIMPLQAGERLLVPIDVHYQLDGGLISRVSTERRGAVQKRVAV
ncbi:MAG: nuclear transport factor 2 family protein [Spongiibacteraceae bacterium]|jgi:ketosteroid isomerase-like protein|nr:nuclear transport factor 2 family protein [Spongiibacteraceae bacterium]